MKLWWHKCKHWEYWPVYIVYMPTFFLWMVWMIRFRSFSFFKLSNPSIPNGGFYGDSKMKIYRLLPKSMYPKTVLIQIEDHVDFPKIIQENQFEFPLIVKPDIGCRGVGVQQVKNFSELMAYHDSLKTDYLIQELIDYPNEIGLFYGRVPSQKKGKITGLTLKKFLTIRGNGHDTLEKLLKKDPRYELQLSKLKSKFNLQDVLPHGVEKCLVPYGNHNRGTLFLDGKEFISEKLENTFNEILSSMDGFYFGRLDIRYATIEELEQGLNFSIIELNGAKSEPTHIYDPKHSFWFGQKEIFRHQMLMKNVILELAHTK
jgi:hypothetical protein